MSRISLIAIAAIVGAFAAGLPIQGAAQKSSRAAGFYDDALARYERKDTAGAIVQLKNALREEPGNLAALMLIGKAQLEMGQAAAAEEALARALQLGIDRSEVALPLGQALLDQAKYTAVLERFPAETVPGPRRAELLVLRGHAHKGLRDMKSAAAAYEAARAADPRSVAAILAHADMLARQGRWTEAEKLVDQGLANAPDDARLLTLRGGLALGRGETDNALAAFGKALEASPNHVNARLARASLLVDLGRLDAAAPDIAQLAKETNDPRVTHLRAVIATRAGDERTARDALHDTTALIDAAPRATLKRRAPELLLVAGMAYAELQERQKARSYLEDYVLVEPKHPGARKLLGSVLLAQGETLAALSALEEAERLQPGDPEVLALMAAAYTARRQYQSATSFLDQALKRSGGAPAMHAAMGMGLLRQGRLDLGIEHLERSLARDRGNTQAAVALTVAYLKRGQTKQALGSAKQFVKQDAKNPVAQNLLGMAHGATGDLKGARAAYERALALEKGLVAATLNLAQLDAAEGQHDAARRRLAGVLNERPRDTQAMTEFASIEVSAGRPDEAIRWLERVRAIQPRNDRAIARLVDLYLRIRNSDKAIAVAKEIEAEMPESPVALGALGRALLALGDQNGARVLFTRMSRLSSADPAALVDVGWLQLEADDARGAAYTAEKALAAQADFLPAQVLLVELELRSSELSKAAQRAKGIAARHPDSPLGYRLLADVAMARKSYPQAIEGYRSALGKERSTASALRLYRAYIQSGATAKGIEFMQTWVKERPNDVLALRALAEGQFAIGDLAAAQAGYEKVLKLRGEDPVLLNNLANVLLRHGDRGGALGHAERAHRLAPSDPSIQDTLGWILVEEGRLQEGLQHLREARLRNSNDPEIRYHLAATLAKLGRRDEARTELEPVLRPGSGVTVTAEARRLWQALDAPQ